MALVVTIELLSIPVISLRMTVISGTMLVLKKNGRD
jgi:hypothetical protein